jgi:hypothetical protein
MTNIKKLIFLNCIIIILIFVYLIINEEKIMENIWSILALVISLVNLFFINKNKTK